MVILSIFALLVFHGIAQAQVSDVTPSGKIDGDIPRVEVLGPVKAPDLQPYIRYYLDDSRILGVTQVLKPDIASKFQPIKTATPDFGYTKASVWLRVDLVNRSELTSDWRLFFRENFMQQFEVHTIDSDGLVDTLIWQNELSTFDTRPIGFPELVAPMKLEVDAPAILLIRYESGGSSELSFSIETIESFEALTSRRTAKNFIYYGMVVLLCIIASMAYVATRQTAFVAYTFYAISALMFIVHADGNGFKYLWPDFPMFNAFATIFWGTALSLACTNFARIFVKTKTYHPLMDKALLTMMAVALATFTSSLFFDHQQIKRVLILVTLVSILMATTAGFLAAITRFKEMRFYVFAWTGVLISAGILTSRHWFGIQISEEVQFDSMRIVLVIDATMMGLAIWDSLNQGRKAQHLALKSSLETARRNLMLSTRLNELEQKFEAVTQFATHNSYRLVNTLHDLRQPLHALRLNVNNLAHAGEQPADQKSIEQTFDYLEKLVGEHLSRASDELPVMLETAETNSIHNTSENIDEALERIHFDDILEGIHEMFLPDAMEKDLDFRFVKSSLNTDANALVMMRMISNLVSNSIKYTDKGKVLLGVRKIGDYMRIEIHDTGDGMSRHEFDIAKRRASRLDKNANGKPGDGHGLAIVQELAALNGFDFDMLCERPSGLSLGIRVPITA